MRELMVDNDGIELRVEVAGDGPVIVCVHGWPELPHSWRHQVAHFVDRGWTVAALDVRGYGASSAPTDVEAYTARRLAGDVAAVVEAVADEPVVLFGHDWGAPIASQTAIRRPDLVRAIANLSVPHLPPGSISLIDLLEQLYADRFFYMLHFQEPDRPEAEFEADLRTALKKVYFAGSGQAPRNSLLPDAPRSSPSLIDLLPEPPDGDLGFMTEDDLDHYVAAFERSGMTGPINRYRAAALDLEDSSDIAGALIEQPSCFVAGELDLVASLLPGIDLFDDPGAACTDFRGSTILPGVGHWVQQEAPEATNAALEEFLGGL